jgi:hypothetical protein
MGLFVLIFFYLFSDTVVQGRSVGIWSKYFLLSVLIFIFIGGLIAINSPGVLHFILPDDGQAGRKML